jgi:hypothetical protein
MRIASSIVAAFLSCAVPAFADIEPIMRYSEVRATASVSGNTNTDSELSGDFEDFDETVSASIIDATGTGSVIAGQRSTLRDPLSRIFASGGTTVASSGLGSSSGVSVFRLRFEVGDQNQPARLSSAIALAGAGDVFVSFKDASLPDPTFYARRAPGITTGPATAIEDYTLLAGHIYDIEISATSPAGQGSTSYTFSFTPVPEPTALAAMFPSAWILARRPRAFRHQTR